MDEDWRNAFGILICRRYAMAFARGYAMARRRLALFSTVLSTAVLPQRFFLCSFVGVFICCGCFVIACSSTHLPLLPWEGYAS